MPASTTPSRVRVEGCFKKKGVYPFNKGPTPGPSQEFSHYLPTASSARQREWDRFWSAVGRSPGSAEQELPGCRCQSPGLRALLEEVDNGRQVSTPAPAGELWGGWGDPEALAGQKKGHGSKPGERGAWQTQGRRFW